MYYNEFKGEKLSALGFGTMRLPLLPGGSARDIDQPLVEKMVAYALEHGINYFDTAAPYHERMSEISIGKALAPYPRDSYYLADKYPGHIVRESYDPAATFEEQLQKCGVEYFDYYLLHNINENSVDVYCDPRWGMRDYFQKQKELGRVRRLGFSAHGDIPCMERFLSVYGDIMEFCQIQVNALDWTLQGAKEKYGFLTGRGLPIWVMEPVRGGKLVHFSEDIEAKMKASEPDRSIASWSFRWLQGLPNVTMVLSGMSDLDQMKENTATFTVREPLDEEQTALLFAAVETLKSSVPCTGCRYCCDGCPQGLDIPRLISLYNELQVGMSLNMIMRYEALGKTGQAGNCVGCGQCVDVCPQKIEIPEILKRLDEAFSAQPTWTELSRTR